ncbi:MAG: tyrosine-type recombinase/integrase [Propionibacteriales bacterium]|nr:tyrosine-type recombinase/integrase [Propionibacteriales bacterium]
MLVQWNRAVKTAGLPAGTYFHDLRHTYASLLIEAGESVKMVSARLGHASAVEILETYSHLWPDSDENTLRVLDAAWERHVSYSCHETAL